MDGVYLGQLALTDALLKKKKLYELLDPMQET